MVSLRAPGIKRGRWAEPATLSVRLGTNITLDVSSDGGIAACFYGRSVNLGKFSASAVDRAQKFRLGLPLNSFTSGDRTVDKEIQVLAKRLAKHGLLEYRLGRSRKDDDLIVIEPQLPDYQPRMPLLRNTDTLVLSRFAYMRRRGSEMVLESPRAGALFRICNPNVATTLALLSTPQQIKQLRRRDNFTGAELLALLVDSQILFKTKTPNDSGLRPTEGDDNLVLWDFHDLLFHTRSTAGRHANPLGGVYPYAGLISPFPATRSGWPGKKIDLRKVSTGHFAATSSTETLLLGRHSTRSFDGGRPITLAELARFLDGTARVKSRTQNKLDLGDGGPVITYALRPYPSAGAAYELELYLAVDKCEGLARGLYHYDAGGHALVQINVTSNELRALLMEAESAMGATAAPQVLIIVTARFGRISWKYSSIAYSLILKDVGVLIQTFYLMATDIGLGGCAIGSVNIELFSKMTGMEFHVEGPVGQFAIGRGTRPEAAGSM
jgi:SagB-type dehydrogenase family enzyme